MKTAVLAIEGEWECLRPWLSPAEQARLSGMRHPAAASQSAHAWLALKRLAGAPAAEVCHRATGRPYLAGTAWEVALTHTPRLAAAAIDTAPIGIDLEDLDRELAVDSFLAGTCTPAERALAVAATSPTLSLREVAIIFWSLKEAACKWADRPLIPRQCRLRSFGLEGTAAILFADGAVAPQLRWSIEHRHVFSIATT